MTRPGVGAIARRCGAASGEHLRGAAAGDIRTPASVRTKLEQVDSQVQAFTRDVAISSASDAWRQAYAGSVRAWRVFYDDARSSFFSQLWGDTYTQAERFEERFADWQADFRRKGYGAVTEPITPEVREREAVASQWSTAAKYAAGAVALVAVAVVVSQVSR